jgi:hypothetical protein
LTADASDDCTAAGVMDSIASVFWRRMSLRVTAERMSGNDRTNDEKIVWLIMKKKKRYNTTCFPKIGIDVLFM